MSGEKDLRILLKNIKPILNAGEFVFCCAQNLKNLDLAELFGFFREEEALTVIVSKPYADRMGLNYTIAFSWITLKVHSSLEVVGFTAAFSKALADQGIGCNVVAGYYHDHLFVNKTHTSQAIQILESLYISPTAT
jgi:uncharacterized protein